jgi:hypothetical protein
MMELKTQAIATAHKKELAMLLAGILHKSDSPHFPLDVDMVGLKAVVDTVEQHNLVSAVPPEEDCLSDLEMLREVVDAKVSLNVDTLQPLQSQRGRRVRISDGMSLGSIEWDRGIEKHGQWSFSIRGRGGVIQGLRPGYSDDGIKVAIRRAALADDVAAATFAAQFGRVGKWYIIATALGFSPLEVIAHATLGK